MTATHTRHGFLESCLKELRSAAVPFCISRNHEEFWHDGPSDVDLIVSPACLQEAVHCLQSAATSSGFRVVAHTWFDNLCIVFHAPDQGFIRIDLDTAIRWKRYTLFTAEDLLAACIESNGIPIPCPEHETLVLLCQCAWAGKAKHSYRERLNELISKDILPSRIETFLADHFRFNNTSLSHLIADGNVTALQACFRSAPIPRKRISNTLTLINRSVGRILNPPGIIIDCPGISEQSRTQTSHILEMAFPNEKAARCNDSALRILFALFRGGIFWNDAAPECVIGRVAHMWSRKPSFRWIHGKIHHLESGQSSDADHAPDFIGHVLGEYFSRTR